MNAGMPLEVCCRDLEEIRMSWTRGMVIQMIRHGMDLKDVLKIKLTRLGDGARHREKRSRGRCPA